ncbi:hypothetical protein [Paenibacillus agaridevorans]|uniref:hypothetical protein n=1 Tax=Paenibacillus agaridevorans TaxID=171404 RepID=UPI001BE46415|nr:hypothetical protein [Paenibacillus agaridevorans]
MGRIEANLNDDDANKVLNEAVDSLCAKPEMKLQSIIANVLTEIRALIWIVWRDFKV